MAITRKAVKDSFIAMKDALRLGDIDLNIDLAPENPETRMMVGPTTNDTRSSFDIVVFENSLDLTPSEFWETVAHEMIHVLTWNYAAIFPVLKPHISKKLLASIKEVERAESEALAYKLAPVIAGAIEMPKSLAACKKSKPKGNPKP